MSENEQGPAYKQGPVNKQGMGLPTNKQGNVNPVNLQLIYDTMDDMLAARGKSHGNFGDNAKFALSMRDLMRSMPLWMTCIAEQRLALDEIALKIARIVSGGSNVKEHWNDIIGYASLGLKGCSE